MFGCCKKTVLLDAIAPKPMPAKPKTAEDPPAEEIEKSKEKVMAWSDSDAETHTTQTEETMKRIEHIADTMVEHEFISTEEAKKQVTAINDFFKGKMSYAEMRAIAG